MPPRPWTPPPAAAPRSPARSTDARPAARRSRPSPGPRSTRAATSRSPSRTRPAAAPSGGTTAEVVNGSGGHVISDGVWNSDGVHDAGYEQNAGTVTDSAGGKIEAGAAPKADEGDKSETAEDGSAKADDSGRQGGHQVRYQEERLEGQRGDAGVRRLVRFLGIRLRPCAIPEEMGPRAGALGDRLRPGLGPERRVRAPRALLGRYPQRQCRAVRF